MVLGADVTRDLESAPITLAVCGDPIVGRALTLLLQGSDYVAKYLSASALSTMGTLEDVQLLLLTPEPDTSRREVRRNSVDRVVAPEILTLELVVTESKQEGEARAWSERMVSWPCSTEDLKQRIKIALSGKAEANQTDRDVSLSATAPPSEAVQPKAPGEIV